MKKENELGSIEKGKAVDMIVLNQNLFEIDPDSIIDCKVLYTIFAGRVVYDAKCRNKNIVDTSDFSTISLSLFLKLSLTSPIIFSFSPFLLMFEYIISTLACLLRSTWFDEIPVIVEDRTIEKLIVEG